MLAYGIIAASLMGAVLACYSGYYNLAVLAGVLSAWGIVLCVLDHC